MRRGMKDSLVVMAVVGLLSVLVGGRGAPAAENAQDEEVNKLESQMEIALEQGAFKEAVEAARAAVSLRARRDGEQHPQTVAARQALQWYKGLLRLGENEQKEVARGFRAGSEGTALTGRKEYRSGEERCREALAIFRRLFGDEHPFTAMCWSRLGAALDTQGKHAEAQALNEKALAVCLKAFGEDSAYTIDAYQNVAASLSAQGKHAVAQPFLEKVLAIHRKVRGEEDPDTAVGYMALGSNLHSQGKYAEAQPLFDRALTLCRKAVGKENPTVALGCLQAAYNLHRQNRYAEAQPLLEEALAISRKTPGEEHLLTAVVCDGLAKTLEVQDRYAEAQPLLDKALAIRRKALGEENLETAMTCTNLAVNLYTQGKYAQAQAHFQKALPLYRKGLGEDHPEIATLCNYLAGDLHAQGKNVEAQPLFEKVLAIRRKVLGEEHPFTAHALNNVAGNLFAQGKAAQAQPLLEKALAVNRKVLGEEHLHTVSSFNNLGGDLYAQGKYAEAQPMLEKALATLRKVLGKEHPKTAGTCNFVAATLWRQEKFAEAVGFLKDAQPGEAIGCFYSGTSRQDLAASVDAELSPQVLLVVGLARLGNAVEAFRQAEVDLAWDLLDDTAASSAEARRIASLCDRLKAFDRQLSPLFEPNPLSADQQALCDQAAGRHREVLTQLAPLAVGVLDRLVLPLADIQKQLPADAALVLWFDIDRYGEHHACIVRPKGDPKWMRLAGSGKEGAWTTEDCHLADRLSRLLRQPTSPEGERQGLCEALAKQRLQPLRPYLEAMDGLPAVRQLLVAPTGWVSAVPLELLTSDYHIRYVPSGSGFARLHPPHRPVQGTSVLALGDPTFASAPSWMPLESPSVEPEPLPGTRREVQALAHLVPQTTLLLGSDASKQHLDDLAREDKLKDFRLIHLATHAVMDGQSSTGARLLLAHDRLAESGDTAPDRKPCSGDLPVSAIRRSWHLDADLVALTACRAAPGGDAQGHGLRGLAQAFLQCGARSVVLSRWKVDETATALLMTRFYENLLGSRKDLKTPLPRAEALEEAQRWLRELPRSEVERWMACPAGTTGGPGADPNGKEPPVKLPEGNKPFAHPCHWAAFILVGDPD